MKVESTSLNYMRFFFFHIVWEVTSAFNEPWSCKSRVYLCMFAFFLPVSFQTKPAHTLTIHKECRCLEEDGHRKCD